MPTKVRDTLCHAAFQTDGRHVTRFRSRALPPVLHVKDAAERMTADETIAIFRESLHLVGEIRNGDARLPTLIPTSSEA